MGFLTKFGQAYGQVPYRLGNTYYVAPAASYTLAGDAGGRTHEASDDHDGLSPTRALRTVARALTLATANAGDTIFLLPGTHTVTATVALSKAGISIVGERPAFGSVSKWIRPATTLTIRGTADELLNITAAMELAYMTLQGTAGYSLVSFQTTGAIPGIHIHDVIVDMDYKSAISVDSHGIDFGNRAGGQGRDRFGNTESVATAFLENVTILSNGANGHGLHLATCNVYARGLHFHNDAGTWATPCQVATNADNTTLEDCLWTSSGTMTLAIAGYHFGYATDVTDGVTLINNKVTGRIATAASAFLGFGANSVNMAENYAMQRYDGNAGGGSLITRAH